MATDATPEAPARPRVGYLGPEGTFSEEALLASAAPDSIEPVPLGSIYETIVAVGDGAIEWAVVPIENSLEGSISVTLDLLAEDAGDVEIVGEALLRVRHSLIAAEALELGQIEEVITHPQVPGQCSLFLRGEGEHAGDSYGEAVGHAHQQDQDRENSAEAYCSCPELKAERTAGD